MKRRAILSYKKSHLKLGSLVSTYVVCERLLWCMSLLEWLKFWSKFYRIPLFWNTVSEYPPRKWKLSEILALWLFSFRIPPPPHLKLGSLVWKLKFGQILALWLFSFRIPPSPTPPPPPPENWNLCRSWHFDFSVSEYPPPLPPENWNLGRSWHFDFSVSEYPPPPPPLPHPPKIEIWADLGTLRLFSFRTMCGKLPHVETLSSRDNYSLLLYTNDNLSRAMTFLCKQLHCLERWEWIIDGCILNDKTWLRNLIMKKEMQICYMTMFNTRLN